MNEDALKQRLRVIAKEKGVSFNEIWKQLLLERFLVRLCHSRHHEAFIFKGGLLLSRYIEIGRETIDADFLMNKVERESSTIESAFLEIISVPTNDGFEFEWGRIEVLAQPHMKYPGYRVTLDSRFGKMKDRIRIDIGVGDLVFPVENSFHGVEYKGTPLFEGEITLLAYPIETIFAEKLETIVSKGASNSRMKDYHDVILIIRQNQLLDLDKLKASLMATFTHRQTPLKFPIEFDASGWEILQRLWGRHLNGLGAFRQILKLPDSIEKVIDEINSWMILNRILPTSIRGNE